MQNYQVVWPEAGIANVEPCAMPIIGPDELLIRTRATLISPGTERAFFLGLPNTTQRFPQYPGYNNVGEVVQIGAAVTDWQVGDRVATPTRHAAYVTTQAANGVRVPDGLPDERAAFFELGSIALQGVRKARIELGEPVVVIGAGLIGLLAMQLAKLQGAAPAIIVDQDEQRLDFAQQAGADAVVMADSHLSTELLRLTNKEGPAVVIEATGHPAAIPTAFDLARQCGRVILLGSTRGETEQVNFYRDVHRKGLTVIGAHNSARPAHESRPGWWTRLADQETAMKLLALDRLVIHPLITHRFPWQQAPQAFALLKQWNKDALGLILHWD
ncbi:MAG: zinc-binding alcohol dehydrogenase [Caldilineaceae bacterium]|nr:zinc-binding alcohol dehydrogenase [Caldilineaceae bacterium]